MKLIPYQPDEFERMHAPGTRYIGSSFVPALVTTPEMRPGWMVSPYAKALDMLGQRPLDPPGDVVIRGADLEPATIAQLIRRGYEAVALRHYCVGEDNELFIASPDYMLNGSMLGEGKAPTNWHQYAKGAPLYLALQCQWQMYCAGTDEHMASGLFVDRYKIEMHLYPQRRNQPMIDIMVAAAQRFCDTVDAGKTPDPDATMSSYRALQDMIDVQPDTEICLDTDEETALMAYDRLAAWQQGKADRIAAEKTIEASQCWFACRARDASIIRIDDQIISRTKVEPKNKAAYFKWRLPA